MSDCTHGFGFAERAAVDAAGYWDNGGVFVFDPPRILMSANGCAEIRTFAVAPAIAEALGPGYDRDSGVWDVMLMTQPAR